MNSVCNDQHKLHQLISPKKHIDLPPRRQHQLYELSHNLSLGKEGMVADDDDDEELDPYSSDHFRMYEFKVRRCTRSRSHDWTDCPFAHPGEKARRRDPRRYHYSGAVCPEFRRGGCSRGDTCEFAHGVFECWLHPSRYRTEACKDGKNCKRKVCFFAHTPRQLRTPSDPSCNNTRKRGQCCCLVCHSVSSPTSTLLGMSHLSPPMSPEPASRCSERMLRSGSGGVLSYKEVLNELMSSLEAMNFNEAAALCSPLSRASSGRIRANNTHWVDTSFEDDQQQQQQFILSSTPSPSGSGNLFDGNFSRNNSGLGVEFDEKMVNENGNGFGSSDPDLGWVNDLLM